MTRTISPGTRRALAAAETRAKVLTSACTLFDSLGFELTDIRSIAREGGVSTGAVFANKEELFEAAFPHDHARRRMAEAICRAARRSWIVDDRAPFYHAADAARLDLAVAA